MSQPFDTSRAIEAVLFLCDEPMSVPRLAEVLGENEDVVVAALERLASELDSGGRGIQLRKTSGGYRLYTHPGAARIVERYMLAIDKRRLTQAALETLAIVAYKQPVTRAEVSRIRGVNAEAAISSLADKGFVSDVGRDSGPGQPILYGTTEFFLEQLGLVDIAELPPVEEFEPDTDTKEQIALSFKSSLE